MADTFSLPSDAFKAGFDAAQTSADAYRSSRAKNALAAAYGPAVQSFADATDQQNLNLNAQLNPLKVQAAQQNVDFNAQLDPLKIQEQQNVNTTGQQTIDANALAAKNVKVAQLHGVLSASLDNLGQSLQNVTDPNQRGALFDAEIQHIAPLIGQDPRIIAQQLRTERNQIVQGGAAAVPQMQNDLDNLITAQLTPQERQQLANTKAAGDLTNAKIGLAKAQTAKAQASAKTGALPPAQALKLRQQATAASNALADYAASNVNTNAAIDDAIKQIRTTKNPGGSMLASGPASTLADVPFVGSALNPDAFKLARTLDTIKANLGFEKLQEIRQSSPTGGSLGSISDFEDKLLQSTIASLDQHQDPDTLVANLQRIKQVLADSEKRMSVAYKTDFGDVLPGAAATAEPAAAEPAAAGDGVVDYSTYFGSQ